MSINQLPLNKRECLYPLIEGWNETLLFSCIQGHMGEVYVECEKNPHSAQFVVADFCFFAGEVNQELVENRKGIPSNFTIMVPQDEKWESAIEQVYPKNAKKVKRFAIKKEADVFDKFKLGQVVRELNDDYEIKQIDDVIYEKTKQERWSEDLCGQFADAKDYRTRGIGFVALHKGEIVAGASSYTVYDEGIEIEIDTKTEHRRKGLAYAVGAKLILECLNRGLYPSWDAQNLWSVALAQKLGYHFDYEYTVYEVTF